MRYNHIPIFQKTYILTLEIHKAAANFGKQYKYSLGEKLIGICHEMIDLILIANASQDKTPYIKDLDSRLEHLRIYVRLAYDLRAISSGMMESLNKCMQEVGVQIGGWQKWAVKKKNPPDSPSDR